MNHYLLFGIGISSLIILNYIEDISTYFKMEYLKMKSKDKRVK